MKDTPEEMYRKIRAQRNHKILNSSKGEKSKGDWKQATWLEKPEENQGGEKHRSEVLRLRRENEDFNISLYSKNMKMQITNW